MSVPAHHLSKARVRNRRSHDHLITQKSQVCPKCQAPTKPHHACLACGYYKSKQVIKTKAEVTIKRAEKKKKLEQKEKAKMASLKNN
ncbi:MAG: 50S ribosomal protein L32 [Patescibacteria group bacterium]